ncbi:MAG: sterol desaturase family protein [Enterobacteriaceae bacterium]|nr:sterol desaturase family protein [Enterobacteriaceae bacterium]
MINHILLFWFLFIFIFDIYFYVKKNIIFYSVKFNRHWRNNFFNFALTKLLSLAIFVPVILYASAHPLMNVINIVGGVTSIILGVVVLDFIGYIFHRLCHKNKFMWRFHEIHHLDEVLDATTGLRVHFFELMLHTFFNFLIIWLLGISSESVLVHSIIGFIIAIFHHSKIRLPVNFEKKLSNFITTPRFHAPHHDKEYKNNNSNYAFIFPVWDRIFKTYHDKTFTQDWNYGLAYKQDVNMLDSILSPFKKH